MRNALLLALLLAPLSARAQCVAQQLNDFLPQLDGARMKATVDKLVTFGTRHTLSDTTSATRGIGAARKWIFDELSRYAAASNGRMTVAYQSSMQTNKRTNDKPVEVVNVVATIKGTSDPNRVYIATGHYDSRVTDIMDATSDAPGADDDASGVAVIMELARVLSQRQSDATIVLAAVAGEEQGLLGATGLADYAVAQQWSVEGDITNDIVGGIEGGSGTADNRTIRIFSANQKGVGDSTSRHWARFVRDGVRTYLPNVRARLVYRLDRFGRGGDHRPFFDKGFPAIRFTEPSENYRRQHQNVRTEKGVEYGDLATYVSADYMQLVASTNAIALATAACAPAAPKNLKVAGAVTDDTTLTWDAATDADLAGYELLVRETTADEWEKVIPIAKASTYTFKNLPIDNVYFGVRAVDKDGNRSPVRTPEER
ncbi:MAG TPA: M28 family metallopeptidase [Thermoanaerobaculia bacterium]|nr:M28 family metallopeptidase [Thermoanaerobaculia bacterium]